MYVYCPSKPGDLACMYMYAYIRCLTTFKTTFKIMRIKCVRLRRTLYRQVVNPFENNPWFSRVCSTSLLEGKAAGKGEIARHEQFLLFPQCFLPF